MASFLSAFPSVPPEKLSASLLRSEGAVSAAVCPAASARAPPARIPGMPVLLCVVSSADVPAEALRWPSDSAELPATDPDEAAEADSAEAVWRPVEAAAGRSAASASLPDAGAAWSSRLSCAAAEAVADEPAAVSS